MQFTSKTTTKPLWSGENIFSAMAEVFQQMRQISRSLNSFSSAEDETFEMRLPITYSAEHEEGKEDHETILTLKFEDGQEDVYYERKRCQACLK